MTTTKVLTGRITFAAANTATAGDDTPYNERGFLINFPSISAGNTSAYGWFGSDGSTASSDVTLTELSILEGGNRALTSMEITNLNQLWFAAPSSDDFFLWEAL